MDAHVHRGLEKFCMLLDTYGYMHVWGWEYTMCCILNFAIPKFILMQ